MKNKFVWLTLVLLVSSALLNAQEANRKITTALPFLQVAADARAGGLGDQGVATSPDAFSQQWNASKYAFAQKEIGVALNVTPYLTRLVNDIILANLVGYKRLNERSAVSASFRYFSLGEIEFRESATSEANIQKPNELSLDVAYSLRLSDRFSMAVAGRYLRSDLRLQTSNLSGDSNAGNGFGVDITGYYQSEEIPYRNFDGRWRGGFAITNIGPKLKYSADQESFIPTNLRLGGGFDFGIDQYNKVSVTAEVSKLLVPTPPVFDTDGSGQIDDGDEIRTFDEFVKSKSAIGSIFSSFNDAPDGFSEELQEFTVSLSAEYNYNDVFALRAGYFNEHESKGARKFFTLGAGFKYTSIGIDMSYLFSTSNTPSPLDGTLRFGLTFLFGQDYREF
ncbi:type IX secretion system outer membrane channel protein PorV [Aquimarina agarilytica]|uniref:type IX secretion system outer membrane channel protein PorV n=1 Tax=Aquimarina agarilytica TaxID=1087449 RepID=UPI0002898D6F|nr:type IX secretion system outer membrane channel protein PorV [Aquimarina agarilytica]